LIRVGVKRRTWAYRYRLGTKNRRAKLGYFPAMGLAEARSAAARLAERVEAGAQPLPPEPHPRATAVTLGELIDRYEMLRRREGRRVKTLTSAMRTVRAGLKPYLGLPAKQFSKADLRAARDAIAERAPLQANRMLSYLNPVLKWSAQEDLIAFNFAPDIRKGPERKRDRVLSKEEIAAIWHACDRLGKGASAAAFGRMVRFLLLTAQRRGEVATLRHGDILDGRWRQMHNKADRPHTIELPDLARELLGQGGAHDIVFAGSQGGAIAGFSKLKRSLDKQANVTGWRLHDLRRTAATAMQELGVGHHVIGAVLNHAVPGVAGVYLRAEIERQKREALTLWQGEICRIVESRGRTRA
jgi:integrase